MPFFRKLAPRRTGLYVVGTAWSTTTDSLWRSPHRQSHVGLRLARSHDGLVCRSERRTVLKLRQLSTTNKLKFPLTTITHSFLSFTVPYPFTIQVQIRKCVFLFPSSTQDLFTACFSFFHTDLIAQDQCQSENDFSAVRLVSLHPVQVWLQSRHNCNVVLWNVQSVLTSLYRLFVSFEILYEVQK